MKHTPWIATALALSLAVSAGCGRGERGEEPPAPAAGDVAPPADPAAENGDALQGTRWRVISVDGAALPEGRSPATIEFTEPGRIAGQAPCNRFMASYDLEGDGFRVGQAASTMMACEPALLEAEQAFLDLLGQVQRRFVTGDALQLVTADDRQIYAERL